MEGLVSTGILGHTRICTEYHLDHRTQVDLSSSVRLQKMVSMHHGRSTST
jgi:hypothetical protein